MEFQILWRLIEQKLKLACLSSILKSQEKLQSFFFGIFLAFKFIFNSSMVEFKFVYPYYFFNLTKQKNPSESDFDLLFSKTKQANLPSNELRKQSEVLCISMEGRKKRN